MVCGKKPPVEPMATTISWRLALELRGGKSWDEAAGPLQRDYDTFTECMGRDPVNIVKPPKTGGKSNTEVQPGKAKGKYKAPRPQPYYSRGYKGGFNDSYHARSSSSQQWPSYHAHGNQWQHDGRTGWHQDQLGPVLVQTEEIGTARGLFRA